MSETSPAPLTAERLAQIKQRQAARLLPGKPFTPASAELRRAHMQAKGYALDDAAVLLAEVERLTHTLTAHQQCQAGHELDCAALTMRAEKAEAAATYNSLDAEQWQLRTEAAVARVKSQQDELGSQQVQMLRLMQKLSFAAGV